MNQHAQKAAEKCAKFVVNHDCLPVEAASDIIETHAVKPSVYERDKVINQQLKALIAAKLALSHCADKWPNTMAEIKQAITAAEKLLKG